MSEGQQSNPASGSALSREQILRALQSLSDELGNQGVTGEVCVFGGTADEPSDVTDIVFLVRHLKLKSAKEVLDLVGQYYPTNRIPVKTQYLVEGLFEEGKI